MTSLLGLFRQNKDETRAVEAVLARVDRQQEVVRIEVERTLIRFNSRLSVRRNAVVVAKPPALRSELQAGGFVRFKVPGEPRKEIRLEVATPHFNLTSNQPVFLCKLPGAFAPPSQRKSERFDTSRFQNLRLVLPGHEHLRILDIAEHGCRVLTPYPHPHERLARAKPIGDGAVQMGKNVCVQMAVVTPRTYSGREVGFSFSLDPGGDNRKLLQHLLRSLEKVQRESMRSERSGRS
jgi:hypothetical protein